TPSSMPAAAARPGDRVATATRNGTRVTQAATEIDSGGNATPYSAADRATRTGTRARAHVDETATCGDTQVLCAPSEPGSSSVATARKLAMPMDTTRRTGGSRRSRACDENLNRRSPIFTDTGRGAVPSMRQPLNAAL